MSASPDGALPSTSAVLVSTVGSTESATSFSTMRPDTAVCTSPHFPSVPEYFAAFNPLGEALIAAGALVFVLTLLAYADTLRRVCGQPLPAAAKTHSAFVVSVYPVVSIATLCALMVPRAQLLAEAITQMVFMAAVYQLWCLLVAYCGGETKLVLRVEPSQLDTRVGPCCCWPCCPLPRLPVNKRALMLLRGLVIQLPVVQGLLYLIMLVIWAEEESLYEVHYMYLQPVVIASILTGIWGLIMTLRMLGPVLSEHRLVGKFLVLQAVLLLSKFQALGARGLAWYRLLPCNPPLTPTVYASLLYNVAMLVEMLLLAVAARAVYSKEVPALSDSIPVVSTVSLRDTHHAQSDRITVAPASESNNNNAKMSYKL